MYHILLKPLILRFHGSKESFSVMWILRTSALVHKILSGSSVKDEFLGRGLQCLQLQHDMKDLLVLILHNLDSCTVVQRQDILNHIFEEERVKTFGALGTEILKRIRSGCSSFCDWLHAISLTRDPGVYKWTKFWRCNRKGSAAVGAVHVSHVFFSLGTVRFWWESFGQKASSIFCACPLNHTYCKNDQEWGSIVTTFRSENSRGPIFFFSQHVTHLVLELHDLSELPHRKHLKISESLKAWGKPGELPIYA